jgi:hypothetical protein
MTKLLVPALCVLASCATTSQRAPAPPAPPATERWSQECVDTVGMQLPVFNELLRSRGRAGWEVVTHVGTWTCFKRPT